MKTWTISDTHCRHNELNIPEVDTVIHAGDCSNTKNPYENELEVRIFLEWFRALPIKYKIYVPGNHDTSIEKGMINFKEYPEITFLLHDLVGIEGLKIFGSPYTPRFHDWAFMKSRNRMGLVWQSVPQCDILVTHGPSKGNLDLSLDFDTGKPVQVGCKSLYNKITELKIPWHIHGHIHNDDNCHNYGQLFNGTTTFINCSVVNHRNNKINPGFIIDI